MVVIIFTGISYNKLLRGSDSNFLIYFFHNTQTFLQFWWFKSTSLTAGKGAEGLVLLIKVERRNKRVDERSGDLVLP